MTARSIFLAATLATLGFASVASEGSDSPQTASVRSREHVRADVVAARNAGALLNTNEGVSLKPEALPSQRSRADVKADTARAAQANRTGPIVDTLYYHGG